METVSVVGGQPLLDLGRRARFDCVYFYIVEAALPIFLPRVLNHWIFNIEAVLNLLSTTVLLLYIRQWSADVATRPTRVFRIFTALKCLQNLSLGCEIAGIFLIFGFDPVTSLATAIAMGFAIATLISMRPNIEVLRYTICCCLLPPALASLWVGGLPGYGSALLLFINLHYSWQHGTRENREYLRTLQQTRELRRAGRKATQDGARVRDAFLANAARHTATVAERNRIAYEWHDSLLAGFSAISWQLDEAKLRQATHPESAAEAIELAGKMVQHYRAEARLVIADLLYEESDTNDLISLIDRDIRKLTAPRDIQFRVSCQGTAFALPPELTRQSLRICQEAVMNAVTHGGPSRIDVAVDFHAAQIGLTVIDNGRGFVPDANRTGHFGLEIMQQRARRLGGELSIESILNAGSTVRLTVPYSHNFTMTPTKILLIEDQYFSRLALHTVIDSHADLKIVFEAETGQAGVEAFREQPADVTIVDLKLPDQSGIDVIKSIRSIDPAARIVVLSNFDGSEYLHRATNAGAMAYLTKDSNADELLEAIRAVRVGQSFIPPSLLHLLESRVSGNELTSREQGVLELLALGWSNKQIADDLGIAEKTVRIHLSSIFSKLGAANRTQAVLIALQRGFVDPQPIQPIFVM